MTNSINQVPFLPNQLDFPTTDSRLLAIVLDKMYIDIASRLNDRTIGIYTTRTPIIIGDTYYVTGGAQNRKVAQRQLFSFTTTTAINHNLTFSNIVNYYGTWTDGTNYYGLIAGTENALNGQIVISITPTQIVFTVDASAPLLTSGLIVIEFI